MKRKKFRGHVKVQGRILRKALLLPALICIMQSGRGHAESTNSAPLTTLAPVTVIGKRESLRSSLHDVVSESELVGPAQQPEWTARRAFAETDIYVIPPGEIEFNQFYISSHPRHEKPENLFESEFEFGLPWRTQFDIEFNYSANGGHGRYDSTRIELPHALADWGQIPLNPTINAGWRFNNDKADAWFVRLLLAEEFNQRIHFGANLTYDHQVGGEKQSSYELNLALTYAAIDSKLAVGLEMIAEYETENGEEADEPGTHSTTVMAGPVLLYRPTHTTHLGVAPLVGLTHDSPRVEAFFFFGIDLEPLAWIKSGKESGEGREQIQPLRRWK